MCLLILSIFWLVRVHEITKEDLREYAEKSSSPRNDILYSTYAVAIVEALIFFLFTSTSVSNVVFYGYLSIVAIGILLISISIQIADSRNSSTFSEIISDATESYGNEDIERFLLSGKRVVLMLNYGKVVAYIVTTRRDAFGNSEVTHAVSGLFAEPWLVDLVKAWATRNDTSYKIPGNMVASRNIAIEELGFIPHGTDGSSIGYYLRPMRM